MRVEIWSCDHLTIKGTGFINIILRKLESIFDKRYIVRYSFKKRCFEEKHLTIGNYEKGCFTPDEGQVITYKIYGIMLSDLNIVKYN